MYTPIWKKNGSRITKNRAQGREKKSRRKVSGWFPEEGNVWIEILHTRPWNLAASEIIDGVFLFLWRVTSRAGLCSRLLRPVLGFSQRATFSNIDGNSVRISSGSFICFSRFSQVIGGGVKLGGVPHLGIRCASRPQKSLIGTYFEGHRLGDK